jgi:hypothetical protein
MDDDDLEAEFEKHDRRLEELWRAHFRRAAESLYDIGVLMVHLSDLMKSEAAENLPEDRQYRFYSRCMSVIKPAQNAETQSVCVRVFEWESLEFCCPCCCSSGQQPEQLHCANCLSIRIHIEKLLLDFFHREREEEEVREEIVK